MRQGVTMQVLIDKALTAAVALIIMWSLSITLSILTSIQVLSKLMAVI